MLVTWRHLPAPARSIAIAAAQAVAAAQEHDRDGLDAAVRALAVAERSGLVLGTVVRLLLEDLHPDGLDGDDIRQILEQGVAAARQWQPTVDPYIMLTLLAGALGIHDQDEEAPQLAVAVQSRHAALLTAHLLAAGQRPLAGYLTAAFAEIERTEVHD